MPLQTPKLEVYFIDIHEPTEKEKEIHKKYKIKNVKKVELHDPIREREFPIEIKEEQVAVPAKPIKEQLEIAQEVIGESTKSLKRLIEQKKFHIIETEDELSKFHNANNNGWSESHQRQYYIRHPKISNRNLLIEAQSFNEYVFDEYRNELVNFITSNCNAKIIEISKIEKNTFNAGEFANANHSSKTRQKRKGIFSTGNIGLNFRKAKGNFYSINNPHGCRRVDQMIHYNWIEPSFMSAIKTLNTDGIFEYTDIRDFSFGLNAGEIKSIGLKLESTKEFMFKIYVEC